MPESSERAGRLKLAGAALMWDWLLLGLAAPFLMFPSSRPALTAIALGLLGLYWISQIALRQPWPVTPFSAPLALFSVMVAVSIAITPSPELTLPKATGLVLGLAVFRSVARLREQGRTDLSLAGLLLAAMGVWAIGLMDLAWPSKLAFVQAVPQSIRRHVVDLPGTLARGVSPNQLAGALVLVIPLALAAVLGYRHMSHRRLLLALGVAGGALWSITLVLTQSRGGWLGGIAGITVFAALWGLARLQRWHRAARVGLPLLVTLAVVLLVLMAWPARLMESWRAVSEGAVQTVVGRISLQVRLEIWQRALLMIRDYPFTGRGLGVFREMSPQLYPLFVAGAEKDIAHAHNVFLQTAVDTGLPGLISYASLLVVALLRGWDDLRTRGTQHWLSIGALAGLAGYHVFGLTDVVSLGSKPSFLFWWVLGLLAVGSEP